MKILIISHNPLTSYQNMGKTMLALFSSFKKEELCQLYIYPTVPDVDKCKSYYRITDKDVLKSYYRFRVKGGEISCDISAQSQMFENRNDEKIYRSRKNKRPFRMLLRDMMWRYSRWNNSQLKNWLKSQQPDCIFVAPGTAKFIYRMARNISQKYNLPIITYICDDYYFVKRPNSVLKRLQVGSLKKEIKKLILSSKYLITICNELQEIYCKEFSVPAITIMTGSNYNIAEKATVNEKINAITFMGNIRCNRFYSLAEIGKALDEINEEEKTEYKLNIYTGEKNKEILSTFDDVKSVHLCGFITGEEFYRVLHSSDLLLHVEAFDAESIDLVKHSVSTKIADSLASGICLLAYGPEQVASIRHLLDNECAFCITSKEKLKDGLKLIFTDKNLRFRFANKALEIARIWHDAETTSKKFYSLTEKINEGNANQLRV